MLKALWNHGLKPKPPARSLRQHTDVAGCGTPSSGLPWWPWDVDNLVKEQLQEHEIWTCWCDLRIAESKAFNEQKRPAGFLSLKLQAIFQHPYQMHSKDRLCVYTCFFKSDMYFQIHLHIRLIFISSMAPKISVDFEYFPMDLRMELPCASRLRADFGGIGDTTDTLHLVLIWWTGFWIINLNSCLNRETRGDKGKTWKTQFQEPYSWCIYLWEAPC